MLRKYLTILVASVLLLVSSTGFAQSKEELARELLELTQSGKLAMQIISQMLVLNKQQYPEIPERFWGEIEKEFRAEELTELVIPVYVKHFTEEDLKAIIAFYRTPAGQKMIAALPQVSQESMEIGEAWGLKIGRNIAEKIQAEQQ